jgi:hypothetical protein
MRVAAVCALEYLLPWRRRLFAHSAERNRVVFGDVTVLNELRIRPLHSAVI